MGLLIKRFNNKPTDVCCCHQKKKRIHGEWIPEDNREEQIATCLRRRGFEEKMFFSSLCHEVYEGKNQWCSDHQRRDVKYHLRTGTYQAPAMHLSTIALQGLAACSMLMQYVTPEQRSALCHSQLKATTSLFIVPPLENGAKVNFTPQPGCGTTRWGNWTGTPSSLFLSRFARKRGKHCSGLRPRVLCKIGVL